MDSAPGLRLFGTDGVRGITNSDLTPQLAARVLLGIAAELNQGTLAVGCDSRTSSDSLLRLTLGVLNLAGRNVLSIGLAPTPAVQFACRKQQAAGAVVLTASHNPPPYNGIKVFDDSGIEIEREVESRIEETVATGHYRLAAWAKIGNTAQYTSWQADYFDSILTQARALAEFPTGVTVAVDCANGVGSIATPPILKELGFRVVSLNANVDPRFPARQPEPTPANLANLSEVVRAYGASLGIAHDGDADRAIFVDEWGGVCSGDESFAILASHLLPQLASRKIVAPVSISAVVRDAVTQGGGELVNTKVGSLYVSRKMIETEASLGGEDNGGVFYAPHMPTRDGAMSAALMLAVLSLTKTSLSELRHKLPRYFSYKEKLPCPEHIKTAVMGEIASMDFQCPFDRTDGLMLQFGPSERVHIRPSGTEPLLRIMCESTNETKASSLRRKFVELTKRVIQGKLHGPHAA